MIRLNWDDVKPILLRDLDARGINKNAVQQRIDPASRTVYQSLRDGRSRIELATLDSILAAMDRDWLWLVKQFQPPAKGKPCKAKAKPRTARPAS